MSAQTNRALAQRMSDEVVNNGRWETVDEIIADDYVYHGPGGLQLQGRDGFRQMLGAFRDAFPDLASELPGIAAEGDLVTLHYTFKGTHTGEFMGIAPTNKKIDLHGLILRRFKDGQIIEDWDMYDYPTFMKQLGVG